MKFTDFGLWFQYWHNGKKEWSTTIPTKGWFYIYYDGMALGKQFDDFDVVVWCESDMPLTLKMKEDLPMIWVGQEWRLMDRTLTLDDFEITPNPDYIGAE